MAEEREKLIMTMREKVEWQSMEDDERVAAVLSYALIIIIIYMG